MAGSGEKAEVWLEGVGDRKGEARREAYPGQGSGEKAEVWREGGRGPERRSERSVSGSGVRRDGSRGPERRSDGEARPGQGSGVRSRSERVLPALAEAGWPAAGVRVPRSASPPAMWDPRLLRLALLQHLRAAYGIKVKGGRGGQSERERRKPEPAGSVVSGACALECWAHRLRHTHTLTPLSATSLVPLLGDGVGRSPRGSPGPPPSH